MKRIFFLASILIILIGSCKKDNNRINYTFKGNVIDYYTGQGESNDIIYLKSEKIDASQPQLRQLNHFDTTSFVSRIITGINGTFDKSLLMDKGDYYMVVYNNRHISFDTVKVSTDLVKDILIKVKGFKLLYISLKNIKNNADSLYIVFDSNKQISKNIQIRAIDTMIVYNQAIPETECAISCYLKKDGLVQTQIDTTKIISKLNVDNIEIKY